MIGGSMRAGHCSVCNQNVYVDEVGNCVNGHSAENVSGVYEVPTEPGVSDSSAAPPVQPKKTSLLKRRWFMPVSMLALGLILGAVMTSGSPDYTAELSSLKSSQADLQGQVSDLQSKLDAVTKERDSLKSELDPVRRAEEKAKAEAAAKAEAEAKAKAEAEAKAAEAAAQQAAEEAANTFTDGVYHVGEDMKAGRYKGHTTSDMGYWAILKDPNGSDIIENNLVKGQFYIQVRDGQYIELTNVEITKTD